MDARDRVLTPGSSPRTRTSAARRSTARSSRTAAARSSGTRAVRDAAGAGGAQDDEAGRACVDFSMAELLRGGVTTVMEIGGSATTSSSAPRTTGCASTWG
jgi:hypothetical protein